MDNKTIDKAFKYFNSDLDVISDMFRELCTDLPENRLPQPQQILVDQANSIALNDADLKWVDLIVQEISTSTNTDDAKLCEASVVAYHTGFTQQRKLQRPINLKLRLLN